MKELFNKIFEGWTKKEIAWLLTATATILCLSIYFGNSPLGIVSAITGVITVVLIAKGKISNFYFALINVSTYAFIAFQAGFYGDVMLNVLYYLPMNIYGIYAWKKHQSAETKSVKSMSLNKDQKIKVVLGSIVAILLYTGILLAMGDTMPLVDATSTILAIVAMMLMVKGYVEQWYVWVLVNLMSITLWLFALMNGGNDIAQLLQYMVYFINSIYGIYNWKKLK